MVRTFYIGFFRPQPGTESDYVRIFCMAFSRFILASNSPRRRELLGLTGLDFEIFPVIIDETPHPGEHPESYVRRISKEKAFKAAEKQSGTGFLISADTIVVDAQVIIGKPRDQEDARKILKDLRGHSHVVHTALIIYNLSTAEVEKELCSSRVPMRDYSDKEIDEYISSGDPMDKAGAYAVQHAGFHPVENFSGCYASVMGFPLCHFSRAMKKIKVGIREDLASVCQRHLNYKCVIFPQVLEGRDIG